MVGASLPPLDELNNVSPAENAELMGRRVRREPTSFFESLLSPTSCVTSYYDAALGAPMLFAADDSQKVRSL